MMIKLDDAYKLVSEVAVPSAAEGLKKERSILLLWFLRNVFGIDDLEAYEYICDGENDQGIDALYLEQGNADDNTTTLVVYQSKYPEKAKNVGINDLRNFVGSTSALGTAKGIAGLLREKLEPELAALLKRFGVAKKIKEKTLRIRLVFVAAGALTPEAKRFVETTNATNGEGYLTCYDVIDLAPIVTAFKKPTTVKTRVELACNHLERFVASFTDGRVAVCSIKAADLVTWPGIDDRTLFELNVRRELRRNEVRTQLDRAIGKPSDHEHFLAFHNGITVVCEKIDDSDMAKLAIENISIVNGAQSTIALRANRKHVTDKLRVLVKFVEIAPSNQLAREVAIRSNTQNPVTSRNLRALDGVQLRLINEFKAQYPSVSYVTSPDKTVRTGGKVINNDDVGQLLCSIFNEKPWVSIKRLSLFDAETYPMVFNSRVTAAHVMLADLIADYVQRNKAKFPPAYQKSWQLTRLTAVYIVGQLLRAEDGGSTLNDPAAAVAEAAKIAEKLDQLARYAASVLAIRRDNLQRENKYDDFKVDFKREDALLGLARDARASYLTYVRMNVPSSSGASTRAKKAVAKKSAKRATPVAKKTRKVGKGAGV